LPYAVCKKEAKVMRAQAEGRIIYSGVIDGIEEERKFLPESQIEGSDDDDFTGYMFICWEFTVDGKRYRGRSPQARGLIPDMVIKRYPVGRRVKVYHDPQNPTQSTIEGLEFHLWFPVVLLIFVVVVLPLILISIFYPPSITPSMLLVR
jgi:hypothetical protein